VAAAARAAAPFRHVLAQPPLPAASIHQVCPPLLFPSVVRDGAPQTLTKLFLYSDLIQLQYITIY